MPFYEYCCQECDHIVTLLQKRTDSAPDACANCGVDAMQRQIGLCGFNLAGSGWYKDGYESKSIGKSSKAKEVA